MAYDNRKISAFERAIAASAGNLKYAKEEEKKAFEHSLDVLPEPQLPVLLTVLMEKESHTSVVATVLERIDAIKYGSQLPIVQLGLWAAKHGSTSIFRQLEEKGVHVNDPKGPFAKVNLLHEMAKTDAYSPSLVRFLVERGAMAKAKGPNGERSVMEIAATYPFSNLNVSLRDGLAPELKRKPGQKWRPSHYQLSKSCKSALAAIKKEDWGWFKKSAAETPIGEHDRLSEALLKLKPYRGEVVRDFLKACPDVRAIPVSWFAQVATQNADIKALALLESKGVDLARLTKDGHTRDRNILAVGIEAYTPDSDVIGMILSRGYSLYNGKSSIDGYTGNGLIEKRLNGRDKSKLQGAFDFLESQDFIRKLNTQSYEMISKLITGEASLRLAEDIGVILGEGSFEKANPNAQKRDLFMAVMKDVFTTAKTHVQHAKRSRATQKPTSLKDFEESLRRAVFSNPISNDKNYVRDYLSKNIKPTSDYLDFREINAFMRKVDPVHISRELVGEVAARLGIEASMTLDMDGYNNTKVMRQEEKVTESQGLR